MRPTRATPPFRAANGEKLPGSIAEIRYRRLGGVDQWTMMRGASVANPPLILLHGGPGLSETLFFRHFNAPLENDFTLVYWDQRGAGKSFQRDIPRASMTVERLIADLDELVEATRARLDQQQVVLFGHSWGSALGVLYAARFPEKVAAYVGSGQIGDWPAAERATYAYTVAEAERRHDGRALNRLRAIGAPPHDARRLWAQRMSLSRLEGRTGVRSLWKLGSMLFGATESSFLELPNTLRGFKFSLDCMWKEVSALDLTKAAPTLRIPVFFFLGRNDHWVDPATSVAYFDLLSAPSKKLVWFEKSGHEPFVDETDEFNAAMVKWVRPSLQAERPRNDVGDDDVSGRPEFAAAVDDHDHSRVRPPRTTH
jgi:pimeloyl-ACP methyl ester carboxylesterase